MIILDQSGSMERPLDPEMVRKARQIIRTIILKAVAEDPELAKWLLSAADKELKKRGSQMKHGSLKATDGKMAVTVEDITYGEPKYDKPNATWQDIFASGKDRPIGALWSSTKGLLSPIDEIWQMGVAITPEIEAGFDCIESEDPGWSYVQFDSLEAFLDFYNTIGRFHNDFDKRSITEWPTA